MKPPIDLNERTNRGRHGQRRAHILWVAEAMAAESGLESITMAALARRIGTSSAALYKHYDSRQALLSALALKVVTQLDAVLCEATVGDAIPPWEELGRIIGVYAALYTQRVSAAVVVTAFVSDPRTLVHGDVRGQVWHLMEHWWSRIEALVQTAGIPAEHSHALAWMVWTTAQGVITGAPFSQQRGMTLPTQSLVRDAVYFLLAGAGLVITDTEKASWNLGYEHGRRVTETYLQRLEG